MNTPLDECFTPSFLSSHLQSSFLMLPSAETLLPTSLRKLTASTDSHNHVTLQSWRWMNPITHYLFCFSSVHASVVGSIHLILSCFSFLFFFFFSFATYECFHKQCILVLHVIYFFLSGGILMYSFVPYFFSLALSLQNSPMLLHVAVIHWLSLLCSILLKAYTTIICSTKDKHLNYFHLGLLQTMLQWLFLYMYHGSYVHHFLQGL